jgi:hypothetical protein
MVFPRLGNGIFEVDVAAVATLDVCAVDDSVAVDRPSFGFSVRLNHDAGQSFSIVQLTNAA